MADSMERISLTTSPNLVEELDHVVEEWDYGSRSEAIRDALRMFLAEHYWENEPGHTVRGSIVIVYDHEAPNVNDELLDLQHRANELIMSVQHVHFDHHLCLETLAVEGRGAEIQDLVNQLKAVAGTKQVRLTTV